MKNQFFYLKPNFQINSPYLSYYKNNLRKNDIITEIGREQIKSLDDYKNALEAYKSGDTIMLRIIKNGQPRYEAFEIE